MDQLIHNNGRIKMLGFAEQKFPEHVNFPWPIHMLPEVYITCLMKTLGKIQRDCVLDGVIKNILMVKK
jgi:hypothetical protein